MKIYVLNVINGDGLHTAAFATLEKALASARNTFADEAQGYYKNLGIENDADLDEEVKGLKENGYAFPEFTADEYYLKEVEVH